MTSLSSRQDKPAGLRHHIFAELNLGPGAGMGDATIGDGLADIAAGHVERLGSGRLDDG